MEKTIMLNLLYGLPAAAILLGIAGVWFAASTKTRWSFVVAIGTSVEAITMLIQRFMPVSSGMLNESGDLITSSPMSLVRQLSSFTYTLGFVIIAVGLLLGAMSTRTGDKA